MVLKGGIGGRRWWHQRTLEALSSREGAAEWARSCVPSPWGAIVLVLMASFVVRSHLITSLHAYSPLLIDPT